MYDKVVVREGICMNEYEREKIVNFLVQKNGWDLKKVSNFSDIVLLKEYRKTLSRLREQENMRKRFYEEEDKSEDVIFRSKEEIALMYPDGSVSNNIREEDFLGPSK